MTWIAFLLALAAIVLIYLGFTVDERNRTDAPGNAMLIMICGAVCAGIDVWLLLANWLGQIWHVNLLWRIAAVAATAVCVGLSLWVVTKKGRR